MREAETVSRILFPSFLFSWGFRVYSVHVYWTVYTQHCKSDSWKLFVLTICGHEKAISKKHSYNLDRSSQTLSNFSGRTSCPRQNKGKKGSWVKQKWKGKNERKGVCARTVKCISLSAMPQKLFHWNVQQGIKCNPVRIISLHSSSLDFPEEPTAHFPLNLIF